MDEIDRPEGGEASAERVDAARDCEDVSSSWEEFLHKVTSLPAAEEGSIRAFVGSEVPPDGDWESFGRAVGSNADVEAITFWLGRGPDEEGDWSDSESEPDLDISTADFAAFSRGVSRSQSIRTVRFTECEGRGESHDLPWIFAPLLKGTLRLEHLEIRHRLKLISHSMWHPSSLECVRSLTSTLQEFSSLKSFAFKSMFNPDDGRCRDFISGLSPHLLLEEIDLSDTRFETNAYASLASILARPKGRLWKLNISRNDIDDECAVLLATGLLENDSLRELCLTDNGRVTGKGWQEIFSALQKSNCTLNELDLFRNQIDDAAATSLASCLTVDKVRTLDLSEMRTGSGITHEGYRALFEPLSAPTCIVEKLFLSENSDLDDEGISYLAIALVGNESIRDLDLERCTLVTAAGWESFIAVLQQSAESILETLHLSGNALNMATASLLANSLIGDVMLKNLGLEDTGLGDDAARLFANSLAANSTLLCMNLADNRITGIGWSAFSYALCNTASIDATFDSNHTVRELAWCDKPEAIEALLELNRENSKSEAARRKIIRTHFGKGYVGVPLFVEMELALLPHALAWMGRGSGSGEVDGRFWGYLRSMPSLFCCKEQGIASK